MSQKTSRVILVEDQPEVAEALRRFLTMIGYKVYFAPDLASARALAKAVEFDVLVSDLRLPDGTGWELMEELSKEQHVRAIAISGYNSEEDIARSKRVGFLNHLAKPLAPGALTAALEDALAEKQPSVS